ncbi:Protein abrupt [Melipona quadrifasciata]|uniref:Protein abrupt n=1 Tax=Melipona quadrifasciata TaxID=166423 RepID=A0A0M8ZSR7_9HYME|nr:Protein abrupt [Melipona quadrifasciata]
MAEDIICRRCFADNYERARLVLYNSIMSEQTSRVKATTTTREERKKKSESKGESSRRLNSWAKETLEQARGEKEAKAGRSGMISTDSNVPRNSGDLLDDSETFDDQTADIEYRRVSPWGARVSTIAPLVPSAAGPEGTDAMAASSSSSSGEQQYSLRWNDFHSSILSSFRHLRDVEDFVDVTLACESNSFTAHKVVLSACSPYFRQLLKVARRSTASNIS